MTCLEVINDLAMMIDKINYELIDNMTCSEVINDLAMMVDKINYELIDNMTNSDMIYDWIYVKPNVTYDYYFERLKDRWEFIINNMKNDSNLCLHSLFGSVDPSAFQNEQIDNVNNVLLDNVVSYVVKPEKSTS